MNINERIQRDSFCFSGLPSATVLMSLLQGDPLKGSTNGSFVVVNGGSVPRADPNTSASTERSGIHSLVLNMVQKKPVDSNFITPSVNDDTTVSINLHVQIVHEHYITIK